MATATKTRTKKPTVQVVISTFDTCKPIYRAIKDTVVTKWSPITTEDYRPNGGTPLLDAIAQFIAHLDKLKKKGSVVIGCLADESGSMGGNRRSVVDGINEFVGGMKDVDVDPDSDGKVLAVILTDGMENASNEVTKKDLQELISEKENEDWTFIYLGANQDAWSAGNEYGFSGGLRGQTVNFASTPQGTSSGLSYATQASSAFLSSNSAYGKASEDFSLGSISEGGDFLDKTGNKYDITKAISEAKESK